ncbi:hypothetical protein [Paenibacillus sp. YPG26]|uniref:hypothetical protein n=1 Tax=Paenibacillus sp. YPG26 TaxID=2878915 RepID=UPI0020401DC5|nr:hypothetical protein [Paenibacillus sp. YPG26]USB34535.1 hypothetical protein LDO05_07155 [Paenibacillus sp. YPG26]
MEVPIPEINVKFNCQVCNHDIEVLFKSQQVEAVRCPGCSKVYSLLKPTIGEEILLDWEREALYHKIKAEKTKQDNSSLVALMIKVAELLTWRDGGNGKLKAIEALRQWCIDNEEQATMEELRLIYGRGKANRLPPR